MSVDPLAEKYPYNSTYAFQENKLGLGRELEGLELVYMDSNGFEHAGPFNPDNVPDDWQEVEQESNELYSEPLPAVEITVHVNRDNDTTQIDTQQNYEDINDLNQNTKLPEAVPFEINKTEPTLMTFWAAEYMEAGWLNLMSSIKSALVLRKYNKLIKSSKYTRQLLKQMERDGPKSIIKSYKKILRRLEEHQNKLNEGLKYSSSVEREIRTFTKQIEELKIFMKKNKIKF